MIANKPFSMDALISSFFYNQYQYHVALSNTVYTTLTLMPLGRDRDLENLPY